MLTHAASAFGGQVRALRISVSSGDINCSIFSRLLKSRYKHTRNEFVVLVQRPEACVDNTLVQSRLTVLGFVLALLMFVTTALLALFSLEQKPPEKLVFEYLNTVVPIALAFPITLAAMLCLITSQVDDADTNRQMWWFSAGQILLYLALSQFLSSGMRNIVGGLANGLREARPSGTATQIVVGVPVVLSMIVWLWLLFLAPIRYLLRRPATMCPPRTRSL